MGTSGAARAAAPSWLVSWVPFPAARARKGRASAAVEGGGHPWRCAGAPARERARVSDAGNSLTREPPAAGQCEDEGDAERGSDVATRVVVAPEGVARA